MDKDSKTFMKSAFDSEGDLEYTVDHHLIRSWVTRWHGHPALAEGPSGAASTSRGGTLLRLRFPQVPDEESVAAISWDEFWGRFEQEQLALEYLDEPQSGSGLQPFARLVNRNLVQADSDTLAALSRKADVGQGAQETSRDDRMRGK